jgi:pilus assembly protein CpaF
VLKVTEITGMEGEAVLMQDIFEFAQTGVNSNGIVEGHFRSTGVRPLFMERLKAAGVPVDERIFDGRKLS